MHAGCSFVEVYCLAARKGVGGIFGAGMLEGGGPGPGRDLRGVVGGFEGENQFLNTILAGGGGASFGFSGSYGGWGSWGRGCAGPFGAWFDCRSLPVLAAMPDVQEGPGEGKPPRGAGGGVERGSASGGLTGEGWRC